MSEHYAVRADHTAEQLIDGEAVVINFDTYHYYGLNRTATAVWSLLKQGGRTSDAIADAVAAACRAPLPQVQADVGTVVGEMLAEGLIEVVAVAADAPARLDDIGGGYVPPLMERHGKLDQLMLSGE